MGGRGDRPLGVSNWSRLINIAWLWLVVFAADYGIGQLWHQRRGRRRRWRQGSISLNPKWRNNICFCFERSLIFLSSLRGHFKVSYRSLTHSLSISLSLSLFYTHTHTHPQIHTHMLHLFIYLAFHLFLFLSFSLSLSLSLSLSFTRSLDFHFFFLSRLSLFSRLSLYLYSSQLHLLFSV